MWPQPPLLGAPSGALLLILCAAALLPPPRAAGLSLEGGAEAFAAGGGLLRGAAGRRAEKYYPGKVDVYYTAEMLDKLRVFLQQSRKATEKRFDNEQRRLLAAEKLTQEDSKDRKVLETALEHSEKSRKESEAASAKLLQFYYTVKAMMGSRSEAPGCDFLACGKHAACVENKGKAHCSCEPCFEGDGFICRPVRCGPVADFAAQPLLGRPPVGYPAVAHTTPRRVAEVQLAVFGVGYLAVAVRDSARGDRGFLVVGRVDMTKVVWGPWTEFSAGAKTYGLALAGLANARLALAYRDEDREGEGFLTGAFMNDTAGLEVAIGEPQAFARGLSQHVVLVPLASSRVVCLYSEPGEGSAAVSDGAPSGPGSPHGGAALVQVGVENHLSILGRYRFAHGELVSRLAATSLSPTSFVVAYRVLPGPAPPSGQPSKELSVAWIGMHGSELVVSPDALTIEPGRVNMWARGLALVSQDLFAYAYESGTERVTKLATIRVNPRTHHMTLGDGPVVLSKGNADFVQGISLPSGAMSPKTFTYFQHPGESATAQVCRVSPDGGLTACKDVAWADAELKAVSGVRLQDGRLAFALATMDGAPMYQLLGPEESGAGEL